MQKKHRRLFSCITADICANNDALHALMARKGFYQTVVGYTNQQQQNRFDLPHATYYGSSTSSCGDVRTSVASAVKAEIQQDIIVFHVQAETWAIG